MEVTQEQIDAAVKRSGLSERIVAPLLRDSLPVPARSTVDEKGYSAKQLTAIKKVRPDLEEDDFDADE